MDQPISKYNGRPTDNGDDTRTDAEIQVYDFLDKIGVTYTTRGNRSTSFQKSFSYQQTTDTVLSPHDSGRKAV